MHPPPQLQAATKPEPLGSLTMGLKKKKNPAHPVQGSSPKNYFF